MSTNSKSNIVRNPDNHQDELKRLHDTQGLKWREIALLPEYSGIPPGTLCAIAKGYPVPNIHRAKLNLPALAPAPVCPECDVVHVAGCPKAKRPRRYHDLYAMPVELLKWKLRNREKV